LVPEVKEMTPDSAGQLTAGDMAVNSDCAGCKRCLQVCPAAACQKRVTGPEPAEENHLLVREIFHRFNRELNMSDFMISY
jgi:Fe-S-cluster-containing hydrogenase component 2